MSEEELNKRVQDFMTKLREQTASTERQPTREDEDRKVKNTIRSWWKNETPAYQHFKYNGHGKPKTDIEYFAHHFAEAGIGLKDGWEYTKETLRGYIDAESLGDGEDNWHEYVDEYNRTAYRQEFRDKIVSYGLR